MSRARDRADSPFLGTKINSFTVSDDATVDISSTYITDDFDTYDVVFSDIVPATDDSYFGCRFGVGGTIQSAGTDYGYLYYASGNNATNSNVWSNWVDNLSTIIVVANNGTNTGLGTGTGEFYNGHVRFHNLRSTTQYKSLSVLEAQWLSHNGHFCETRATITYGWLQTDRTNKVDTLQFSMGSGNVASGTLTLYGLKP